MGGTDRPTLMRFLLKAIPKQSGKLRDLDRLLKTFPRGEKVLIFSFSVQMLGLLQAFATTQEYSFLLLDGSTPGGERQGIIDRFTNDKNITLFFISTKAGGLGLNLTCASKVVIFDVNWNPTHDLQVCLVFRSSLCVCVCVCMFLCPCICVCVRACICSCVYFALFCVCECVCQFLCPSD